MCHKKVGVPSRGHPRDRAKPSAQADKTNRCSAFAPIGGSRKRPAPMFEYCQRPPQLTEFPRNTMGAAMSISVST
jgi:hypothetical protein